MGWGTLGVTRLLPTGHGPVVAWPAQLSTGSDSYPTSVSQPLAAMAKKHSRPATDAEREQAGLQRVYCIDLNIHLTLRVLLSLDTAGAGSSHWGRSGRDVCDAVIASNEGPAKRRPGHRMVLCRV